MQTLDFPFERYRSLLVVLMYKSKGIFGGSNNNRKEKSLERKKTLLRPYRISTDFQIFFCGHFLEADFSFTLVEN